nr:hypothetical protein [Leptospira noguchii]
MHNNDREDEAYVPYTGTFANVGLILFGPLIEITLPGMLTKEENSSLLAFSFY